MDTNFGNAAAERNSHIGISGWSAKRAMNRPRIC